MSVFSGEGDAGREAEGRLRVYDVRLALVHHSCLQVSQCACWVS